jgi:hypothetical protein
LQNNNKTSKEAKTGGLKAVNSIHWQAAVHMIKPMSETCKFLCQILKTMSGENTVDRDKL